MNPNTSILAYALLSVLGTLIIPIGSYYLKKRMNRNLAGQIADKLLKLSGKEIADQAKQIFARSKKNHLPTLVPLFMLSSICMIIALLVLPESSPMGIFIPLIGPLVMLYFVLDSNFSLRAILTEDTSIEILERGRFAQIDGWMKALSSFKWIEESMLWEENLYSWGSWSASELLTDAVKRDALVLKTKNDFRLRNDWLRCSKELNHLMDTAQGMDIDGLEAMADMYLFWRRLLQGFEQEESLDMLGEMEDSTTPLKKELMESLKQQKAYLNAYPHLFCPRCSSRGVLLQRKYARYVVCECNDSESLITGIENVVGMIGDVHPRGVNGGVFYLPVWDENRKRAITGEVNKLIVAESLAENLDWALLAFLESQSNRYTSEKLKISVQLPKGKKLKENTRKILKDYPNLLVEEV